MSRRQALAGALLLVLWAALPSAAAVPVDVQAEIEYLLGYVRASDCTFYRNGTWSDAAAAEAHLREKYAFVAASGRIGTAADFIAKVATRSSLSGQAYEVSCNGGAGVPSGQWLTEALDHHREVNAKPGTRLERARPDDDGPPSAVRM